MFHYGFSMRNDAHKAQVLKSVQDKKQALLLAHQAFHALKLRANEDGCVTYEQGGRFLIGSDAIERKLAKNSGYRVKGIFQTKPQFACCFNGQDLRKPLAEVMQGGNCLKMTDDAWKLAQRRWKALKCDESLPPSIFPPLIEKIEVVQQYANGAANKQITVHFFNPYDRPLKEESFNITVDNEAEKCVRFKNKTSDCKYSFNITNGTQYIQLKIKNGPTYNIPVTNGLPLFKISGSRKSGFVFDVTDGQKHGKSVAWRPKKEENEQRTEDISLLKEKLPMESWLDKVNACFFNYENTEPYDKVNNFESNYANALGLSISDVRNYFWNKVVVNPCADVFCFNGPRAYIERRLRTYGIAQNQVSTIAAKIIQYQPYASATSFLKTIISCKEIENVLPRFEHLSHRTETFKIEAWYGKDKCEMLVQREAKNETKRTWKVVCIRWHKLK